MIPNQRTSPVLQGVPYYLTWRGAWRSPLAPRYLCTNAWFCPYAFQWYRFAQMNQLKLGAIDVTMQRCHCYAAITSCRGCHPSCAFLPSPITSIFGTPDLDSLCRQGGTSFFPTTLYTVYCLRICGCRDSPYRAEARQANSRRTGFSPLLPPPPIGTIFSREPIVPSSPTEVTKQQLIESE